MIAVAKITKSVGLKGLVQAEALSGDADRLLRLQHVFVGETESRIQPAVVEAVEARGKGAVLKFRSVENRNKADELRGLWIFVEEKETVHPKKGSYFVHEIVGLRAVNEDGADLGVVSDVLSLPAGDAWVVKTGEREVLVPAVKEFIRDVDLQRRVVVIRMIEGLME